MKHLALILLVLPFTLLGVSFDSNKEKNFSNFAPFGDLNLIAEFRPDRISRNQKTLLVIYGRIESGFHIYSIHSQGEFAPAPTRLILKSHVLTGSGDLLESKPVSIYDETFNLPLKVHKNEFQIRQKFHIDKSAPIGKLQINGLLQYQVCDNRICSFPLKTDFKANLDITE